MYDQYLSPYVIINNADPQKFLLHKGIELARRTLSKILYVVDMTNTAGWLLQLLCLCCLPSGIANDGLLP
jgi:hypothetical protein